MGEDNEGSSSIDRCPYVHVMLQEALGPTAARHGVSKLKPTETRLAYDTPTSFSRFGVAKTWQNWQARAGKGILESEFLGLRVASTLEAPSDST